MDTVNVVVCGFEHYDNVDVNPSREVCETLARDGVADEKLMCILTLHQS